MTNGVLHKHHGGPPEKCGISLDIMALRISWPALHMITLDALHTQSSKVWLALAFGSAFGALTCSVQLLTLGDCTVLLSM